MTEPDGIFTEALTGYVDRHRHGQELQRIGAKVMEDCEVYGMSVWKRNEDGSITPVDPSEVTFLLPEPEADGSFTSQLVRSQIAKRNAKTKEAEARQWVEEIERFHGPGENDG